jgi:diaphanous 1
LDTRLSCWYFKFKFNNEITSIRPDIISIINAAQEVLHSEKFQTLLALILSITNFLNAKTSKKDTYGFKLGSLLKIGNLKSTDNKSNLLEYLSIYCETKYPDLLKIMDDFKSLESATRVALPETLSTFNALKKGKFIFKKLGIFIISH